MPKAQDDFRSGPRARRGGHPNHCFLLSRSRHHCRLRLDAFLRQTQSAKPNHVVLTSERLRLVVAHSLDLVPFTIGLQATANWLRFFIVVIGTPLMRIKKVPHAGEPVAGPRAISSASTSVARAMLLFARPIRRRADCRQQIYPYVGLRRYRR